MAHPPAWISLQAAASKGQLVRCAIFCLIVFGSLALIVGGCDPGTNVTFKNQTDSEVTVWEGSSKAAQLKPNESKTFSILDFPGTTTYRVTDGDGVVLFERTFTFDELKDFGDIVVAGVSPSPSPP